MTDGPVRIKDKRAGIAEQVVDEAMRRLAESISRLEA